MIDLNAVLAKWGGGGHPGAAAASIKLTPPPRTAEQQQQAQQPKRQKRRKRHAGGAPAEVVPEVAMEAAATAAAAMEAPPAVEEPAAAEEEAEPPTTSVEARAVLAEAMEMVVAQVPTQVTACELMTKTIVSCAPGDTMDHALALMNRMRTRAVPVLESDGTLVGYIKYRDPVKAARSGKGQQQVKAWMRRTFLSVGEDTPFAELEAKLLEGSTGRLHVLAFDEADGEEGEEEGERRGKLLGLITRTDLLRYHRHYEDMERRVI